MAAPSLDAPCVKNDKHAAPGSNNDETTSVAEEVDELLREGKRMAVTLAEEQELLSPSRRRGALASLAST